LTITSPNDQSLKWRAEVNLPLVEKFIPTPASDKGTGMLKLANPMLDPKMVWVDTNASKSALAFHGRSNRVMSVGRGKLAEGPYLDCPEVAKVT
jgi:hypothetical protein